MDRLAGSCSVSTPADIMDSTSRSALLCSFASAVDSASCRRARVAAVGPDAAAPEPDVVPKFAVEPRSAPWPPVGLPIDGVVPRTVLDEDGASCGSASACRRFEISFWTSTIMRPTSTVVDMAGKGGSAPYYQGASLPPWSAPVAGVPTPRGMAALLPSPLSREAKIAEALAAIPMVHRFDAVADDTPSALVEGLAADPDDPTDKPVREHTPAWPRQPRPQSNASLVVFTPLYDLCHSFVDTATLAACAINVAVVVVAGCGLPWIPR